MGASAYSVQVTGDGDMNAARAAIWNSAHHFIRRYVGASAAEVFEYLDNNDPCAGTDKDGDRLYWWFRDLGGAAGRSACAWVHWLSVMFASDWDTFNFLARQHGYRFSGERPILADLLTDSPDRFVVLRGEMWHVDGDALYGDDRELRLDDLSFEERDRFREAQTLCRCDLCARLRPDDPADVDTLLRALGSGLLEEMTDAAWYLIRLRHAGPEILTALIKAGSANAGSLLLSDAIRQYAPRVADAWPLLRSLLPDLDDAAYALALFALDALNDTCADLGEDDRAWFARELRAVRDSSGDATRQAAVRIHGGEMATEAEARIEQALRTRANSLDLSDLGLTRLPYSISDLTGLTVLNLKRNRLAGLPERLRALAELKVLVLTENCFTELPDWLGELPRLTELHLAGLGLDAVPDWVANLGRLTVLNLIDNDLTTLPDGLANLTELTEVGLGGNPSIALPDWLGDRTGITHLYLHECGLSAVPDWLANLTKLSVLSLHRNRLTVLPDWFAGLSELTDVGLGNNRLIALPERFGDLNRLTRLFLHGNELTALPDSMAGLTELVELTLDRNRLAVLPDWIGRLTALTRLQIRDNELTALPDSVVELVNLRTLRLDGNKITTLPAGMAVL
ncbi:leucine-rich repeat domain-containing protein [Streptosporangiaceae bacterium NEAU-GS5]|nr:leucine-rich repeat domain-containing protein [Streptosporangiaceae bacterium NEAU-GS5]